MKRYTELLYWVQYRKEIHIGETLEECTFSEKVPQRAIDSFCAWFQQRYCETSEEQE